MRIEIKDNEGKAIIITFHTKVNNFDSSYERIKFFKGLHGWKQTVPKNDKKYCYHRKGILDEIPHVKIADSVFMVAMRNMERIMEYFDEWEDKVEYDIMEVKPLEKRLLKLLEDF
ncbi:hypothetical protein ACFLQN_03875 [Candidatus Aenigmatarchaeota archaeon]